MKLTELLTQITLQQRAAAQQREALDESYVKLNELNPLKEGGEYPDATTGVTFTAFNTSVLDHWGIKVEFSRKDPAYFVAEGAGMSGTTPVQYRHVQPIPGSQL